MNPALYLFLDILTGMVISVMVVANTLYGQATTMGVSLIVNHTIGLTILSLILLVGRSKPAIRGPGLKAPWYLYFNGLFGLAILNLNYYTVINAGASLAMASTVFGQSICSLVFDLTGWMGMQKRSLNKTKAVSLLVSLAGILAMATSGDGTFALFSILLGILAGALTMTQMVLNSTLAIYKGPIRASHQNFIGGLAAGLVFYFLLQGEQTLAGLAATPGLPLLLVFSGGTLAVFVVVSTSYVIVKIPAVYSALLLSSAQILMSLAIDTIFFDSFSLPLLLGSLLMLLGMGGNLAADKKANP
jgi:transporter family-2 protein